MPKGDIVRQPNSRFLKVKCLDCENEQIIFGNAGKIIVALGAIISCFGCLNGWILLQGEIAMAAGVEPDALIDEVAKFQEKN